MKRNIILASTSPRRKELLEKTGLVFHTTTGTYEEDMTLPLMPNELAMHLSMGKAQAVGKYHTDAIIIAADTFLSYENKVLGKPHTKKKAKEILSTLSGKTHFVLTGFTVLDSKDNKSVSRVVETRVHFKKLTKEEIDNYVATGESLDKAGAYAIQGLGSEFVDRIEGSYSNVIGLPVEEVLEALKDFGIVP